MKDIYETVYDHVSGEDYCIATATERWSKNMFTRLKEKYPDEVTITTLNPDGSMVVKFPYSWFPKVRPPKKVKPMTDEQKKIVAKRLAAGRENKLYKQQ